jgi:hypothetical protein
VVGRCVRRQVTEAIHKGVPVVAYQAGGIPLQVIASTKLGQHLPAFPPDPTRLACRRLTWPWQIRHGETGFLVPVGDTAAVADHLFKLLTDKVRGGDDFWLWPGGACGKGGGEESFIIVCLSARLFRSLNRSIVLSWCTRAAPVEQALSVRACWFVVVQELLCRMQRAGRCNTGEEYFTAFNAVNWFYIFLNVSPRPEGMGGGSLTFTGQPATWFPLVRVFHITGGCPWWTVVG